MILVDTSVILEFWKNPTPRVRAIFEREEALVCGVTRAELCHGARSESDLARIEKAVDGFRQIETALPTWSLLGRNLYKLRRGGITVPFQDALIATVAIEHRLDLWTYDRHFPVMAEVLADLRLFDEAKHVSK